jgi:hypothetical protein
MSTGDVVGNKPDALAVGDDPSDARLVNERPQPRQTPSQGAAGIIRHGPEQGGQAVATMRTRSDGQIGEQRARLPRRRQLRFLTVA